MYMNNELNNELKRELLYNYITLIKMIDSNDNSFQEFVNNNELHPYEYELSCSLHQKEQLFHRTLAMIYNKLTHKQLDDIQKFRRTLQTFANVLIQEREHASNLCGNEYQYIDTCDDTKKKLDGIDGYIALVC